MNQDRKQEVSAAPDRKQYVSPVLVEYGSISKLTQTGAGPFADGGVGFMNGACL